MLSLSLIYLNFRKKGFFPLASILIQQFSAGNIDYVQGPGQGDLLIGPFDGQYEVELSNEGITSIVSGSRNNGLYVYKYNDQSIVPYLDLSHTLLNGETLVTFVVGDMPAVQTDANPIRFTINFNPMQDIKLGRSDTDNNDGDSGNVFVNFGLPYKLSLFIKPVI